MGKNLAIIKGYTDLIIPEILFKVERIVP